MARRLHGSFGAQDRTAAILVYALYLFGLINGLTILIGLLIATLNLRRVGPTLWTHHLLQIRTVAIAVFWLAIGGGLILLGSRWAPGGLSGASILTGWLICGSTWLWFAIRSVTGLLYLLRNQPHPHPRTWLI